MKDTYRKLTTLKRNENGEELIFNSALFKKLVSEMIETHNHNYNEKRGGQTAILRMIARKIQPDPIATNATFATVKKWYLGKNGPSCIEDVQIMEDFFDCSLLMVRPGTEKAPKIRGKHSMNTNECVFEARRNAARKVYGVVCDLIRAQQKLLNNYWNKGFPLIADPCVPDDFPVYSDLQNEIRKYGFDLPRDLIEEVMRFVRDIYGSWDVHLEEAAADLNIDEHKTNFDKWLGRTSDQNDFFEWCEFLNEQTITYYEILDEIFDEYVC